MFKVTRAALLVAGAAVVVGMLMPVAPAVADRGLYIPPTVRASATVQPLTFAAVGDSITAWVDYNGVECQTWPRLAQDDKLVLAGGWAKGGAKLELMLASVTPVAADVLVIMAGTNDLGDRWGTPMQTRLDQIQAIAATVGVADVVIMAVAPLNGNPMWAAEQNEATQILASQLGWAWFDPWTSLRAPDGQWVAGWSVDGLHPTVEGQAVVAGAVRSFLFSR